MSFDGEAHETRRNTDIAIGVTVAAVAMVGLLFWLFNSLSGPALAVAPGRRDDVTTATDAAAPPEPHHVHRPPTIASWTPVDDVQPPPAGAAHDDVAVETQAADQPSAPATTAGRPRLRLRLRRQPGISNVNLNCSKGDGSRVTARLTFDDHRQGRRHPQRRRPGRPQVRRGPATSR